MKHPEQDVEAQGTLFKKSFFAILSGGMGFSGIDHLVNGRIGESIFSLMISLVLFLVHDEMLKRP